MKRYVSLVLVFALAISLFSPMKALGDGVSNDETQYDKKMEEAIVKCKKLFGITDAYDKFDYNINSYDGTMFFNLSWADSKGKLDSINVNISSEGTIFNYYKYKTSYEEYKPKLPKVTKEEGLKNALEFIKKVNPSIINNIELRDNSEPLNPNAQEYVYEFVRKENGIPYYDNNLFVSVDKTTGEVRNFNLNWKKDLKFPDVKGIISKDKAIELYKEKIGLKLVYRTDYEKDEPNTYLAYTVLNGPKSIDAISGEVVSYYDYYGPYYGTVKEGRNEVDAGLSPDETKAVESIGKIISENDAEKKAREYLNIDDSFKLDSINLYQYWKNKGDYIWGLNFSKGEGEKEYYSYNVQIDGKTGELTGFHYTYPVDWSKGPAYDREQSLKLAKEYVKKINPSKFNEVEYIEMQGTTGNKENSYYFHFIRKNGNAYVENDGIDVSINAIDGTVISYNYNWHRGDLAPQDKVISLEKAYDILFNSIGMELRYITTYDYSKPPESSMDVKLCYCMESGKPLNIDAGSGKLLNANGKPFVEKTASQYKDIDKSYARDKIKMLAEHGIYLPGDEFKPKDKINQRDFLYLILKAKSPYFEVDENNKDESMYSYLINMGIVKDDEKAPEELMTKEQATKFVVRALGYEKIAQIEDIYKDVFKDSKDIDKSLKGYVSIAYGLKIVQGSNGYFKPKYELSREDAAVMIFNYLFNN